MQINHYVEVQGTDSPLRVTYKYALTDKGFTKVHELLRRSNYAGACPVTLEDYAYMVSRQRTRDAEVTREKVERAFSRMVLAPDVIRVASQCKICLISPGPLSPTPGRS